MRNLAKWKPTIRILSNKPRGLPLESQLPVCPPDIRLWGPGVGIHGRSEMGSTQKMGHSDISRDY